MPEYVKIGFFIAVWFLKYFSQSLSSAKIGKSACSYVCDNVNMQFGMNNIWLHLYLLHQFNFLFGTTSVVGNLGLLQYSI